MTPVVIADTNEGLEAALDAVFAPHGGVAGAIPRTGGTVYIKPNGVHFLPQTHTDPRVLEAVLAYLRGHGYDRLAVMDGCSAGSLTRLVFEATGYSALCRRYGAEQVFLDEGPTVSVALRDGTRVRIAQRLEACVVRRTADFYLSLPKLKTHSMTTVSLGVKNQQGFPIPEDRMACHTHDTLHWRLAALYDLIRPDFCIVDGLTATAHGHIPAAALLEESVVPMDVLIGGRDTLAVDVVGARVLGYGIEEVAHLECCAAWGLGHADVAQMDVQGAPLTRFSTRVPHALLRRFHPEVRWVIGRRQACVEGCRGNSECIQELMYNDHGGRGGWTLVCGSGFDDADLADLVGDILVVGVCACQEVGEALRTGYRDRRVYLVAEHNDLMTNIRYQSRLMGIRPIRMAPVSALRAGVMLVEAWRHGSTARVPPLLG